MTLLPATCERARAWVSLRADGELSQLESALLDAHLGRCGDCRAFAHRSLSIAAALRSARLERPRLRLTLPRRRRRARRLLPAVLLALAIAVAVVSASARPAAAPRLPKPVVMVASTDSPDDLRELRVQALRNRDLIGDSV